MSSDAEAEAVAASFEASCVAARSFISDAVGALVPSLYNGAPVQRTGPALDALCAIVAAIGFDGPRGVPELSGVLSSLASPLPVIQIINLLFSAFDTVR